MKLPNRDIHNHLLPGVDDGFRHAEDSLRAIEKMAAAGVKEFIFTPHMNPDVYPEESEEHFKQVYADFSARIPAEWGVKTSLAAEYMVVNDFERRVEHPETLLHWPDGSILIEMSYYFRSENLEQAVFELVMAGFKPILAHPERYLYQAGDVGWFDCLKDMGCRLQMNCMSLSGCYGPDSVKILAHLLKHDLYDFVATDLHTLGQLQKIQDLKVDKKISRLVEKLLSVDTLNVIQ